MQNTNTTPTPETDALMLAYGKATASGTERPAIWPLMKALEQERNEMRARIANISPPPTPPSLVKDWADLALIPESDTHQLKIDIENGNGWIHSKIHPGFSLAHDHYLSTHTFYGTNHEKSTKLLQSCGFNVICANWDQAEPSTPTPSDQATDAARYRKLKEWMSSNVPEGWKEVENLGGIACHAGSDEFDAYLDSLPECNVGLCYKRPTE